MKRKILRFGLTMVLLISPVVINKISAQIPDPNQGGNGPPVGAPLDGGAMLVLALGAIVGSKKIYQVSKKKVSKV
ncbi:MAG: hypothetical protein WCM76_14935 [Bacteroidota bacterium]